MEPQERDAVMNQDYYENVSSLLDYNHQANSQRDFDERNQFQARA